MFIFILIFLLLLILYGLLIEYYRRAWHQLPPFEAAPHTDGENTTISVIISVRNEEENLPALLQSLADQDYPAAYWELIIVDDHSTDRSQAIVQQFHSEKLSIRYLSLADFVEPNSALVSFKKKAIETGILHSSAELIVTTDADCSFDTAWLSTLEAFYRKTGARFIAAPVKIRPAHGVLNSFQTLDFITLQGITAAAVHKRIHSMCNGANLAYPRDAFIAVTGFAGIDTIPSGDDMLLMHKIYLQWPDKVFYLRHTSAIVTTAAAESWKQFFHQRIRWASKANQYQDKRIFRVLLLVYLVNACYLILTVLACFDPAMFFLLALFFLAKLLIEFPFVNGVARFFGQQRLMRYFLLLQPLHILYTLIAGWLGSFGSFDWKGRRIKKTTFTA